IFNYLNFYKMKKAILKIFGVAALAAGMLYNVQVFNAENGSDISLGALENMAVAQNEGGSYGGLCCQTVYWSCYHPIGIGSISPILLDRRNTSYATNTIFTSKW